MRGTSLLGVGLLVGACGGGQPSPPPSTGTPTPAPTPAVTSPARPTRAVGQAIGMVCPAPRPPEGLWRLEQGRATGETEAEAVEAAKTKARRSLLASVGANLTPDERREVEAAIDATWVQPVVALGATGGFDACVTTIVRVSDVSQRLRRFREELQAAFHERAAALSAAVGPQGRVLRLVDPVWADGRSAEVLGRAAVFHWKANLGKDLRVADDRDDGWATEVRAELGRGGDGCTLLLQYRRRGERSGWANLDAVSFHPLAIAQTECAPPAETFLSDRRMGLAHGRRAGAGGLDVRIGAPTRDGMLCEGERFDLHIEASAPAWVRVYSVAEDGRVLLGWASERPVQRWTPDDRPAAVRLPGNQGYRIVAVAVPAAAGRDGFGDALPPPGCFGNEGQGLDARRLPLAAAVDTLSHGVTAAGRAGCSGDEETRGLAARLRAALERLPRCGETAAR